MNDGGRYSIQSPFLSNLPPAWSTLPPPITVTGAHWLDRRTGRWAVTVQPDGGGDIVITLPKDRYCVADLDDSIRQDDLVPGAPCAAGNRPLTNEPTATVPGPPPMQHDATENTQAEGAPRIQGDPDVGETLSADTTSISDADGLEGATFGYQWLSGDAEIDGATGPTYTVVSGDESKAITVRVDFTDDAGNEESLTSAATAAVSAGLQLRSATLDGATLTLTYNETLDEGGSIPGGAFTVTVAGSAREVTGVSVSGSSVTLTLASEAAAGDAVTVDYTRPKGRYFIRDTRGRVAPSFSGRVVSNDTAAEEQSTSRSQAPRLPAKPGGGPARERQAPGLLGRPGFRHNPHRLHRPVEGVRGRLGGAGRRFGDPGHRDLPRHHRADRRCGVRRSGHRIHG